MEDSIKRGSLKSAFTIGISTFIGFSSIFIFMFLIDGISNCSNWKDIGWFLAIFLTLFGYFLFCGTAIIGLIEAAILGAIAYFIFKFLLPAMVTNKQKILTIIASIICAIIGLLSFSPADRFIRESSFGKEKIWEIDTNGDKNMDKWVHDDIYGKTIEIDFDTNFDGKRDVWEYYKNGKIYKKEIDADFDGKSDKVEEYK